MEHPLRRMLRFMSSANYSRTLAILALLLVAAAVPLTVYVGQQRQELRQRASLPRCDRILTCTYDQVVETSVCSSGIKIFTGTGCEGSNCDGCTFDRECSEGTCYVPPTATPATPEPTVTPPRSTCHDVNNQYCMGNAATCAANNDVDGSGTCPENQHCCKRVPPTPTATPQPPAPTATTAPPPPTATTAPPPPATATPGTGGPSCLPWTESNCSEPGGTRCSNWGRLTHCGWSQAKWDTCRFTTCASATPVPTATPIPTNTPVPTVGPGTPTPIPTTPIACIAGDAIPCNGCVNLLDYNQWVSEYIIEQVHGGVSQRLANFDGRGGVDLADYAVWANQYISHPERRCP